ncbi:DUF1648 domain-containing protein [Xylocopilactobacillus apis]|uniref:Membrane protein n=1 Tax=Xylocopilactobacillus apis TaxID=2932183 RepID=A0AAU9D065_9LACO|nr:DUF1648 domain-containing protein [Xylocopilactobacillus apis]BDR55901.1 membrane protein [Xylocopilactobacillus apis]
MKNKRNLIIWSVITVLIILAPIILGLIFYHQLPAKVPSHFGVNNEPDNFIDKRFAVFLMPIIAALLQLVFIFISNKIKSARMTWVLLMITPVISTVIYLIILSFGLGHSLDVGRIVVFIIGIVFLAIGNYFPTLTVDQYRLIHYNWKITDPIIWSKLSRKLGYSFVISGAALLISLFFNVIVSLIIMGIFIIYVLGLMIYSTSLQVKSGK